MKTYGGVVSFTLRPLYPLRWNPDIFWIGGFVDCRDDLEKRKLFTLPGLEQRPSVFQSLASRHTDYLSQLLD
jgi:hypothetical protein